MYLIFQRYKFKSKLQRRSAYQNTRHRCIWYFKGTNLKANYNWANGVKCYALVYLIFQRYKFKSKLQHNWLKVVRPHGCIWYFKGTNLKANYNLVGFGTTLTMVYLIFQRYKFKSKLQRVQGDFTSQDWCIWYFKGTNLKANYNSFLSVLSYLLGVFDISKVQI